MLLWQSARPWTTGTEPLQRFEDPAVEWREYWPSPTAQYYAEMLMFSSCHYRLRYAYTYTVQFDEFWYAGEHTPKKTLPAFLDEYMHPDAASMSFSQVSADWAPAAPLFCWRLVECVSQAIRTAT